jgi:hypothetical protein
MARLVKLAVLLLIPLLLGAVACMGPRAARDIAQGYDAAEGFVEDVERGRAALVRLETARDPLEAEIAHTALLAALDGIVQRIEALPAAQVPPPPGDEDAPVDWENFVIGVLLGIGGTEASRRGLPALARLILERMRQPVADRPAIGRESEKK